MTTRADVDRLYRANNTVLRLIRSDLNDLFRSLPLGSPEGARDLLLEVVPLLVEQYGNVAGAASAEWFEDLRSKAVPGTSKTVVARMDNLAEVSGSVRYAAGHLFTDNPDKTLALLSGAVQRHVLYGSRETIRRNVGQDRSKPRWARVPSGSHTCAFCMVVASRGFAYHTRESAGGGFMNSYHDDCDCMIVPEWDSMEAHIEGYDPDKWYEMYLLAGGSKSASLKPILHNMRAMFPDEITDGLVTAV